MTSEARDPDPEGSPAEKPEDRDDSAGSSAQQAPAKDPLRHSRTSGGWIAVVVLLVVIISLAIFVLQNTQQVNIAFLGWNGRAPLAAALLIATAAGLLLAVAAGSLRILQLRRRVKRVQRSTQ